MRVSSKYVQNGCKCIYVINIHVINLNFFSEKAIVLADTMLA